MSKCLAKTRQHLIHVVSVKGEWLASMQHDPTPQVDIRQTTEQRIEQLRYGHQLLRFPRASNACQRSRKPLVEQFRRCRYTGPAFEGALQHVRQEKSAPLKLSENSLGGLSLTG